jgi:hypothetical protein
VGQLERAEEQVLGLGRDEDADDRGGFVHIGPELEAQSAKDVLADPVAEAGEESLITGPFA